MFARFGLFLVIALGLSLNPPAWAFNNSPVQGLHQEIQSEMEIEEPEILPYVEVLWRHALMRNPTLQLAIQKMAEKTGKISDKEKSSWTQNMLQGLIQMGGFGGAVVTGNPTPLIGSTVLSHITAPTTAPKRLTEVTSADLVILTREIEQAQSQLILNFYHYRQALDMKAHLQHNLDNLQQHTKTLPQDSAYAMSLAQTLLTTQATQLQSAMENARIYRNLLVLTCGEEAVAEVDTMIGKALEQKKKTRPHEQPLSQQNHAG